MRGAEYLVEVGLFFDGAYGSPLHQFDLRGNPLALLGAVLVLVAGAIWRRVSLGGAEAAKPT